MVISGKTTMYRGKERILPLKRVLKPPNINQVKQFHQIIENRHRFQQWGGSVGRPVQLRFDYIMSIMFCNKIKDFTKNKTKEKISSQNWGRRYLEELMGKNWLRRWQGHISYLDWYNCDTRKDLKRPCSVSWMWVSCKKISDDKDFKCESTFPLLSVLPTPLHFQEVEVIRLVLRLAAWLACI